MNRPSWRHIAIGTLAAVFLAGYVLSLEVRASYKAMFESTAFLAYLICSHSLPTEGSDTGDKKSILSAFFEPPSFLVTYPLRVRFEVHAREGEMTFIAG